MARPFKDEDKLKHRKIPAYFDEATEEQFKALAKSKNMSVSGYLYELARKEVEKALKRKDLNIQKCA